MTGLSLVACLAVYGVFREVTGRTWEALALYVPFLALSLFPWAEQGLVREFNGNYFGVLPGRYLGPFVVAWLCALAVRRRRLPIWLPCFAAGLTTFNNAEFGTPCALALLVALFAGSDQETPITARARVILGQATIGFLAAAALVCAVVLVRTGELPDPGLLTYYSNVFARQGFGLEPMPTLGLHIALYLTYVAALLTAAVRYVSRRADRTTTAMLAYAAVFGLLTTEYFAGRSLPLAAAAPVPRLGPDAWTARLGQPAASALAGLRASPPAAHDPPLVRGDRRLRGDGRGDRHLSAALATGRAPLPGRGAADRSTDGRGLRRARNGTGRGDPAARHRRRSSGRRVGRRRRRLTVERFGLGLLRTRVHSRRRCARCEAGHEGLPAARHLPAPGSTAVRDGPCGRSGDAGSDPARAGLRDSGDRSDVRAWECVDG